MGYENDKGGKSLLWLAVAVTGAIVGCGVLARASEFGKLEGARRAACQHNLHNMGVALVRYKEQHGRLPESLDVLVQDGVLEQDGLQCPTAAFYGFARERPSYQYRPEYWDRGDVPVVVERRENHDMSGRYGWLESRMTSRRLPSVQHGVLPDGRLVDVLDRD